MLKLDYEGCYYLNNIFSMENELCMCNISMKQKMCRLHNSIKNDRIAWLRTLKHNYLKTYWKLSESKTFNNYLCYILIEPVHEISNNVVCATSKASEQPAHTRSLIRAFACSLNIL